MELHLLDLAWIVGKLFSLCVANGNHHVLVKNSISNSLWIISMEAMLTRHNATIMPIAKEQLQVRHLHWDILIYLMSIILHCYSVPLIYSSWFQISKFSNHRNIKMHSHGFCPVMIDEWNTVVTLVIGICIYISVTIQTFSSANLCHKLCARLWQKIYLYVCELFYNDFRR